MRCSAVQSRLVAWQDDELSPGEAVQVTEHLAVCAECRDLELRLQLPELAGGLVVPYDVAAQLEAATSIDKLMAEASRPDRRSPFAETPRWRRWLVDEVEVPGWSVIAAAAVLALTVGWAVQMTVALADAEATAAMAARAIPTTGPPDAATVDLPADQFKPASYQPGEDHGYR